MLRSAALAGKRKRGHCFARRLVGRRVGLFSSDTVAIVHAIAAGKRRRAAQRRRAPAPAPAPVPVAGTELPPPAPARHHLNPYHKSRLIETSRPVVQARSVPTGVLVLGLHTAVIAGVVVKTLNTNRGADRVVFDTTVVFIDAPMRQPEPRRPATPVKPKAPDAPRPAARPAVVPPVVAPIQVPSVIPEVDSAPQFPAQGDSAVRVASDPADGAGGDPASANGGHVYDAESVEQRPVLRSTPPTYPPLLDQLGIEGRVVLVAVIDTTGRVEPASIEILESSHPGFDEPTRRWALRARFRPGRSAGRPVRVLVKLPINYKPGGRRE